MATSSIVIEVRLSEMPETLAAIRKEVVNLLNDAADDEDERTAARIRQVALEFEMGFRMDDGPT